ncbi:hypothetical protein SD22575_5053 [Shigella dysenteriae 225-75]|nr:hypothetical protein SD22575_5053 [Shigella dysenteriae 225-75]
MSSSRENSGFGYPQDLRHEQKIYIYQEPLLADDVSKQNPDIMGNGWA